MKGEITNRNNAYTKRSKETKLMFQLPGNEERNNAYV